MLLLLPQGTTLPAPAAAAATFRALIAPLASITELVLLVLLYLIGDPLTPQALAHNTGLKPGT